MPHSKLALLLALVVSAGNAKAQQSPDWYEKMDYGPYLSLTAEGFTEDNVALKGRLIFLGEDSGVLFDTELLRVAAMWQDGKIELRGTAYDGAHGPISRVRGTRLAATAQEPGWAKNGSFEDPREIPYGPLPEDHGRFRGLYLNGDEVVLEYTIGDARVREHYAELGDHGIVRELQIAPVTSALTMVVTKIHGRALIADRELRFSYQTKPSPEDATESVDRVTAIKLLDAMPGAGFAADSEGRVLLTMPPCSEQQSIRLLFWDGPQSQMGELEGLASSLGAMPDLADLTKGGSVRWPEILTTKGHVSTDKDQAYVLDTITVPETNPWGSWLRFAAFDFIDAGSAALSTWNGDVWIVSGIDADLDELKWKRFATGLHDPLGLKVVDGQIITHGRDQLTRLHDLNGDGEADYYETFNNDVYVTKNFHEFAFDLQTDQAGNFYFAKGGPVNPGGRGFQKIVPHHGTIMRVTPDGKQLTVYASGLRAPNGISVSADGMTVTSGENEGTWVPKCRINWMHVGAFNGVIDTAHRADLPEIYDDPLCFLPMAVDNSGGGQIWVTSDSWGPLQGELLHQSYGQCNLYLVLKQFDGQKVQGGVVKFPLSFDSSQMRGRFSKADGQLYVTGFKGWQTRAAKDTAFQRVRYTGAPLRMATDLRVDEGLISITFSEELDAEVASDPSSWQLEHWNYDWSENYGSPEVSVEDPERKATEGGKNRDALAIHAISLSPDRRTVYLRVDAQRVMQMRIGYSLDSAEGALIEGEIHNTVNFLGRGITEKGDR